MISRGPGKVRSFRVSSKTATICLFCLGIFVVGFFLFLTLYIDLRRTGGVQKALIEQREPIRTDSENAARTGKSRDLPKESNHAKGVPFTKAEKEQPPPQKRGKREGETHPAAEKALEHPQSSVSKQAVGIENFTISRNGEKWSAQFRVKSETLSGQQVEGYVFAIAKGREDGRPAIWSCPKTPLLEGAPLQYREGQRFKIRSYRDIRCTFLLDSSDSVIHSVNILVYDETGQYLLKKAFSAD